MNSTPRARGKAPVRPGSMTAVMRAVEPTATASGPRWLRFAVVRDGRIVQEATRAPHQALSIGYSGDVVSDAPTREIASCHEGRWRLRVAPEWRGRTAEGDLAELDAESLDGGWRLIELPDRGRARLELPDVAILIQVVAPPPAKMRPRLPVALQGGVFQRADWAFTAFVAASFMMHFAAIAFLMEADWPVETAAIPDRFVEVLYPTEIEPEDPPEVAIDDGATEPTDEEPVEVAEADVTAPSDASPREPSSAPSNNRAPSESAPSLSREEGAEIARATHEVLGALMGEQGSAFDGLRDGGASLEDQASLMAQMEGVQVASNEAGPLAERGGASPGCRGCDQNLRGLQRRQTQGPVDEGSPVPERVIVNTVTPGPVDPYPTGPDPDWDTRELLRTLRARMSAVRRCYENEITHGHVQGGGRISLSLQVMPAGNLAHVRVTQNTTGSESLAACAVRVVSAVRVRGTPSDPMTVSYPIVFSRTE